MNAFDPGLLAWCLPLLYALAAVPPLAGLGAAPAFRLAETVAALAAACALVAAGWAALATAPADPAGHLMTVLIGLLGWVIVRYSRQYLQGEPRLP